MINQTRFRKKDKDGNKLSSGELMIEVKYSSHGYLFHLRLFSSGDSRKFQCLSLGDLSDEGSGDVLETVELSDDLMGDLISDLFSEEDFTYDMKSRANCSRVGCIEFKTEKTTHEFDFFRSKCVHDKNSINRLIDVLDSSFQICLSDD